MSIFSYLAILVFNIGVISLFIVGTLQGLKTLSCKNKELKNHYIQHSVMQNLLVATLIAMLVALFNFAQYFSISFLDLINYFISVKILFFIMGITLARLELHLYRELLENHNE